MSINIIEAKSRQQLDDVARFRYETYVEEMNRPQKYADHVRRMIHEPLDEHGRVAVAYDDQQQVIGTMRLNYASEGDLGEYRELYRVEDFGDHFPNFVTISTKLMVARKYRASSLGLRFAIDAYRHGMRRGALLDFIDCNEHLEPFFYKLGYRPYRGRVQHEEYGDVLPMVLYSHDFLHLSLVKSPFLRHANQFLNLPKAAYDHRNKELLETR